MKLLLPVSLIAVSLAIGITAAKLRLSSEGPSAFSPEPAFHEKLDPKLIDRNIAFHTLRVQNDPKGAIGMAMLAGAWLAKSREFDQDVAAWKAEECSRRSLSLREAGNSRGILSLVNSLLEQHRFQDAIATLHHYSVRDRTYADCLIEVGRYADADRVLRSLPHPDAPNNLAVVGRLASVRGDHRLAIKILEKAYAQLESNSGVNEQTMGWFKTKIAKEYELAGNLDFARSEYLSALRLHPESYKAALGLAAVEFKRKDFASAIAYSKQCLRIANSLNAKALIGDSLQGLGRPAEAAAWYAKCESMYNAEVAWMDRLHKGGRLGVRPIDRQFATFCATHRMFEREGLPAAKRDLENRPDPLAKANLTALLAATS